VTGKLHCEVASEAVGALDQDHAHAIARDSVEHHVEARPFTDRVRTGHRSIVEPVDDGVAVRLGKRPDRRTLPLVAVLVGLDVRGGGGP
jgi:hypothetical protein